MYGFDKEDIKTLGKHLNKKIFKFYDKIPNNLKTRRENSITQPES
jgi:hypothetical protein